MHNPFAPNVSVNPSSYPNAEWSAQTERYEKLYKYFSGESLSETIVADNGEDKVKYPLKINLAKVVAMLHTHILLGEWNDRVFNWRVEYGTGNAADIAYLDQVYRYSKMNSQMIRQLLTHSVLGGHVWRITSDSTIPTKFKWTITPPEYFFPVYSSVDGDLLEAFVSMTLSAAEARARYGITTDQDEVAYMEHWTKRKCEITIDDLVVKTTAVIDGIIPYEYIPRANLAGEAFGLSVIEDVIGLQDEINLRLGDAGDAILRETHKEMVVSNVPGGIRSIRREKGVIDLGVGLGNAKPTVHDYQKAAIPAGAFEFVNGMNEYLRHTTLTPAVAWGEDEGSQRSGMTLMLRMLPMLQAARTNRAFISDGLSSLARKTRILAKYAGVNVGTTSDYAPDFAPMLPKDREQIVNEISLLRAVDGLSDERMLDLLDVPENKREEELARIRALREEKNKLEAKLKVTQGAGNAGSTNTNSGSNGSGKAQQQPGKSGQSSKQDA